MHFLQLPAEILLLIVDHAVDVADVAALEQTCKYMNELINAVPQVLWKHQLENECNRKGLFKPSYAQLYTAEDFKLAATESYALSKAVTRAFESRSTVRMTSKPLVIPQDSFDPDEESDPIDKIWLVPGGRFLVLFGEEYLKVLDITMDSPRAVVSMEMPDVESSGFDRIVYQNVVDDDTFHIIYQTNESSSSETIELDDRDVVYTFVYLEFTVNSKDSNTIMSVNVKGKAMVVPYWRLQFSGVSVSGDNVLFLFDQLTVLWNPGFDMHTSWILDEELAPPSSSITITSSGNTAIYISKEAVYGLEIPEKKAWSTGSAFVCAKLLKDNRRVLRPDFILPHIHKPLKDEEHRFPICRIAPHGRLLAEKREIFYEMCYAVELYDAEDPEKIISNAVHHRYRIILNASAPGSSTLTHLASLPFLAQRARDQPQRQCDIDTRGFQVSAGGRRGRRALSLWDEHGRGPSHISSSILESKQRAPEDRSLFAVPLSFPQDTPATDSESWYVQSSMCAASAKIVSLWDRAGEDGEWFRQLVLHELM